jgi:lantibiotic modifying enzyme
MRFVHGPLDHFFPMKSDIDVIRAGADSVFGFIRRTVERDGARCRWMTADYANQFHYGVTLFNGVGGIPLFLADYARLRKNEEAQKLGQGALEWCADPAHGGPIRGLHFGKAGPAFAVLQMDSLPASFAVERMCDQVTTSILRESPGPVTDMLGGASSNGFYLLQASKKRTDPKLLNGAMRCGEWLRQQLTRDNLGCHCLVRPDCQGFGDRPYLGFAHGISGVAFFFSLLYESTHESVWKETALELFETLFASAQPTHGGWNWSPKLGDQILSRCQWSHGAPGVGMAFLRAAEIFDDPRLLHAATMAGEATYSYGDFRTNATQCVGLAGSGDFLLELWSVTRETRWLDRALDFGNQVLRYRDVLSEGDAWPTDAPGVYSADFMYGAAGIGHFLLRLETQAELPMPLIGRNVPGDCPNN